ncbi:hypothetical protein JHD50_03460 [Sulfurimonas sp. MAG313]|nr:hypothetical protein [Sulfurimonas sp. MAG313]MDF1880369.1 hypothetical protein [Sulfurimonas sp. MAG313]
MKSLSIYLSSIMFLSLNVDAFDDTKMNGKINIYYGTQDETRQDTTTPDIFNKDASYIDTAFHLELTTKLSENVSAKISTTAVSSLGLEENLASLTGVWSGAHSYTGTQTNDALWIDELWFDATLAHTKTKLGRQSLDTPLIFSETWSLSTNTFESIMILNQDLRDTDIIAGWIGKSNSVGDDTVIPSNTGAITSQNGKFNTFSKSGAYLIGAINTSIPSLSTQAWYYNITGVSNAYWLQADLNIEGILAGVQYTLINSHNSAFKDDLAYAFMLGYEMKDLVTIKAAFSLVDDEGSFGVTNIATRNSDSGAVSKLYTEMWFWYGTVSSTGAQSISLTAETSVAQDYELFFGYWKVQVKPVNSSPSSIDEYIVSVAKSFGPVDTLFALVYDKLAQENGFVSDDTKDLTTFQIYLTYNF